MKTVRLPSGELVSALGQGTWFMGEQSSAQPQEIAALRLGLELGMTLIDTAEMYADGRAEVVVGKALSDRPSRRDAAFVVSKVYPHNASRSGTITACERSLKRLQTDRIDLYLLHWRGQHPLAETVQAFEALKSAGKIRDWGVSNLDVKAMTELWQVPGGQAVAANQVLYNLGRRGVEWDLLPWLHRHGVATMAYSPIEQARLLRHKGLQSFAIRHGLRPAPVALAWLIAQAGVMAIPKSTSEQHLRENAQALHMQLTPDQLAELDQLFAPPRGPQALEVL